MDSDALQRVEDYLVEKDGSGSDTVTNIAEAAGLTEPDVIAVVYDDQRRSPSERRFVVSGQPITRSTVVTLNTGGRRYVGQL